MTLLEALIAYSVAHNNASAAGVDAFYDFMPDTPDNCIVFYEYAGDPVLPYAEHVHRSVQVKVRGATSEEARSKATRLCSMFSSATESRRIDFTDTLWGQAYIRQLPFKLEQDERNRVIYCFNLGITTNVLE